MSVWGASSPILERESELELIRSAVAAAESGDGVVLVVRGPAGIGKTRLLSEARAIAAEREVLVLFARGGEVERDLPWGAVRQLVDPVLRGLSGVARERLFADAGGLAAPIFGGETAAAETAGTAAALVYGMYWVLVGLTVDRPAVLVVDDAGWADGESLRWLAFLAPRLESLAASVLVSVRTGDPDLDRPVLAELIAASRATILEPGSLSGAACRKLISAAVPGDPTPGFVEACQAVTGGNPFLLEELVRQLVQEHVQPIDASVERVRTLRPDTIARSVLLRLARLGPDAVALARAVSVLGPGREARDAAGLARLNPDAAARAHVALAAAEILRSDPRLEFVHPLVRAAIYDELSGLERSRWHERAARALSAARAPVEEVAAQLLETQPGDDRWVRETLRAGARTALHRGAWELSARLMRRALREAGQVSDRPELLFELGRAEFAAHGAEGLGALEEALALARDPQLVGSIALELGRALHAVGNLPRAAAIYAATLRALSDAPPDLRRLIRANFVYTGLEDRATFTVAVARLREAADELGRGDPADAIILACLAVGTAAGGGPGAVELAERALSNGWLLEQRTPALTFAVHALTWCDEIPRAAQLWEQALATARRTGDRTWMSFAACFYSHVAYRMGDLPAAETYGRDSLRASDMWDLTPPDPASFLCDALVEQGLLDEADAVLEDSGYERSLPERQGYQVLLFSRARLRVAQSRIQEAVADLRELCRRVEGLGIVNPAAFPWRSTLAIALASSAPDEAAELAAIELERARGFGAPRALGIALRGAALASTGTAQVELLSESVEVLAGSRAKLELARSRVDLGAALRRNGHRADAREALREGLDEAERCHAHALAARARDELRTAGARPQRGELRGRDVLTASETRIARMAATGMTNPQIAQTLFVTRRTVETHLTSAYRKLSIATRDQLPAALERTR